MTASGCIGCWWPMASPATRWSRAASWSTVAPGGPRTDRLDAQGLLRVLMAYCRGDRRACSMVRVPTPEEEDAKRPHREREHLVQERVRIENRLEALLATQGIRGRPSLRSWERDMAALRTGDGRELPVHLRAELDRLRRRLVLTLEMIGEVEAERAAALAADRQDDTCRKIEALRRIRGIGETSATVLAREVLYRPFGNRKQLASYVGLAPMPHQSGGMDRDRRISRSGNPRARTTIIQLAWLWLRYQPGSALAGWFRERCRHAHRADPADRHRGHGTRAAGRAPEVCPDRVAARGRRDRGVDEIAADRRDHRRRQCGEHDRPHHWQPSAAAFQVGRVLPGPCLVHEAFWCGTNDGPDRM